MKAKLDRAVQLHRDGHRQKAERVYRKILKSHPNDPDALHFLGLATYQAGDHAGATRLIRQALKQQPDYTDALKNLGNVLLDSKKYPEAEECYQRVIDLDPDDAAIYSNLSVAQRYQGRFETAIQSGKRSVAKAPEQLICWYNLGNAYKVDRRFNEAIACYKKALGLNPKFFPAHDALCRSTLALESRSLIGRMRYRKTTRAYNNWLEHDPENAVARFMLDAIQGRDLPRAPDSVVRGIFDRFATTFEPQLEKLEYRVPQLVHRTIQNILTTPTATLTVLDGGCGTGLCARYLVPYASRLVGVDLSPGMLELAGKLGTYDELIEAELTEYLQHTNEHFDLIVFGDTLCYFGDLSAVIAAASARMTPGGLLVFSVEKAESKNESAHYQLHPHGRYSHTSHYVEQLLRNAGMASIEMTPEPIRLEVGKEVAGLIVSAVKYEESS